MYGKSEMAGSASNNQADTPINHMANTVRNVEATLMNIIKRMSHQAMELMGEPESETATADNKVVGVIGSRHFSGALGNLQSALKDLAHRVEELDRLYSTRLAKVT